MAFDFEKLQHKGREKYLNFFKIIFQYILIKSYFSLQKITFLRLFSSKNEHIIDTLNLRYSLKLHLN